MLHSSNIHSILYYEFIVFIWHQKIPTWLLDFDIIFWIQSHVTHLCVFLCVLSTQIAMCCFDEESECTA